VTFKEILCHPLDVHDDKTMSPAFADSTLRQKKSFNEKCEWSIKVCASFTYNLAVFDMRIKYRFSLWAGNLHKNCAIHVTLLNSNDFYGNFVFYAQSYPQIWCAVIEISVSLTLPGHHSGGPIERMPHDKAITSL